MIEVGPGDAFTTDAVGYPTGLVGTLGVTILAADGSVVTARSVAGITEDPVGDHGSPKYTAALFAPDTAGSFQVQFDDGAGVYSEPDDLLVDFENALPTESFASVDDLEARLRLVFDADETTHLDKLLRIATGLIQDTADGQTIFLVNEDTISMPGRNDERIVLPQRPVVSVASVTLDGEPLVGGRDWYLDGNAIVRMSNTMVYSPALLDTLTTSLASGFGYPFQTLEIVYTHGYAQIPELYRAICMEAVVRAWVNPGSVIEERIGDVETTYAPYADPPRGLLLTDNETRRIRRQQGGKRMRGIWIG